MKDTPTRTFYEENFGSVDVKSEYDGQPVEAETLYHQALSYILGYITTKKQWKPLICDTDGRLLVSTSSTKSNTTTQSKPAPTTSSAVILSENTSRKLMIIENTGSVDVYLAFRQGAATTNDFKLVPSATYIDDVYYGEVRGITASGTGELRVVEMM